MNEERIKAYVNVIQQLLSCPQGKEEEILYANTELVDTDLVSTMNAYAEQMEDEGDSNANWLKNFAKNFQSMEK